MILSNMRICERYIKQLYSDRKPSNMIRKAISSFVVMRKACKSIIYFKLHFFDLLYESFFFVVLFWVLKNETR